MSPGEVVEWAFALGLVLLLGLVSVGSVVALLGLSVSLFVDWLREQRATHGKD